MAACGIVPVGFTAEVACALEPNHNSPHKSADGSVTWEPNYAADLRRVAQERLEAIEQAVELLRIPPGEWDEDDKNIFKWLQGLVASA